MEISDKNIAKLAELLDSATPRRVVVVSHFNPDGDAIASWLSHDVCIGSRAGACRAGFRAQRLYGQGGRNGASGTA